MKTLKHFLAVLFPLAVGITLSAQSTNNMNLGPAKTETLKVWGNCDMCKTRIEKAVYEAGATSANWDQKTKLLTLTFNPSKTNLDVFGKKLAAVGHDTEKYKADDKAYNALPACCKYERAAADLQAYYTCPMHPEVHSDKPGKCPECGMNLVKKDISKPDAGKNSQGMQGMHNN
jgi:mercuric ion binding protein